MASFGKWEWPIRPASSPHEGSDMRRENPGSRFAYPGYAKSAKPDFADEGSLPEMSHRTGRQQKNAMT
jgi:hypothetical protein